MSRTSKTPRSKSASKSHRVSNAAASGDRRRLLVAMRNLIAEKLDEGSISSRDLASLTKRLADMSAEIEAIDKAKDVDGFHPLNVAALWQKQPCTLPCTPKGILKMLRAAGVEIAGKEAVVIGRSNIVGLPVSKLLLDANATVTMAHSRTRNLGEVTRRADILVVAIGRPKFVTADMVRDGAVVIDVGVNRDPETGKLCGDVDFAAIEPKASVITPVPGGVGPMTICCLMENTIECFLRRIARK